MRYFPFDPCVEDCGYEIFVGVAFADRVETDYIYILTHQIGYRARTLVATRTMV